MRILYWILRKNKKDQNFLVKMKILKLLKKIEIKLNRNLLKLYIKIIN